MSAAAPATIPFLDERPEPLLAAGAFEEPCVAGGPGVLRLLVVGYEFPLIGGRRGHLHRYGTTELPLALYVAVEERVGTRLRVAIDPELFVLFQRLGQINPDVDYLPLDPEDDARLRATYHAVAAVDGMLEQHWLYSHSLLERVDADGRHLLLEQNGHRDYDDTDDLFEISADRSELSPLQIRSADEIERFATVEMIERARARDAELERERAERATTGLPDPVDELPF